MIIRCVKLAVLVLSHLGYWEYFRTKYKINIYFAPLFTIAVQFCTLFIAGILNFLQEAAIFLSLTGVVLLVISLHDKKLNVMRPYLNIGFLYFATMLVAITLYTNNQQFAQIDNFTHWGLVVQNMLNTDRFPSSQDVVIKFISYPLGSSTMIYYYCKFLGPGEDKMMLAQGFLMICTMLPVYSFARKHVGINAAIIVISTALLFQYVIPLTELLVDTLLPLAGMASVAFVYQHCVVGDDNEKLPFYYALPIMIWTMNIKHAALLYIAATFIMMYAGANEKSPKKALANCFFIVFAARSVWNRHCSYINPEVSNSKHAMSLNWFSSIIGNKTLEDILNITEDFLHFAFFRRELCWILAFSFLLSFLAWAVIRQKKLSISIVISIVSAYVIYGAGVLGMYIFSMPIEEGLNAVDRYMKSGDIAIYYMILIFTVSILARLERHSTLLLAGMVLVAVWGCSWWFQVGEHSNSSLFNCTSEERQRWEAPIAEYGILAKQSYLLCVSQEDYLNWQQFPKCIWYYRMSTLSVNQVVITDEAQLENEKDYDYVVILDTENPVIQKWLQENYPDNIGSQVIQHFL